ncbi:endonuclease [Shewanella sp. OPT22]|nr:endonuclease [Shewanella sp. OPT22]
MKTANKLTAVSVAVAGVLSCAANADVMITEYVEGGASNKAIELFNSGTSDVNLDGYQLVRYKDGSTDASAMGTISGVTLGAGEVLVVKHKTLTLADSVNAIDMNLQFNGGDAVALTNGTNNVDVVGVIPTPSSWGKDVTLQRSPDSVFDGSFKADDWVEEAKDTFTGLGLFGADIPKPDPFSCEGATIVPIHKIQGDGSRSDFVPEGKFESEDTVTVKGVVTARGESMQKGFYIQDLIVDGDPATSDGIFVFMNSAAPKDIQPGVEVCLEAKVKEFYDQTQLDLSKDKNKVEIGEVGEVPAAVPFVVGDEENLQQALERYEGMKIVLDAGSEMKVTRSFSFDYDSRRNNMVLSHKAPLFKATQLYMADSEDAVAHEAANRKNELFLESDYKAAAGVLPYMSDFNAETGYIRIGDQLTNLEGMVGYTYGNYRLIVGDDENITAGDILRGDDRVETPAIANEGDLRIASFNVLNYFNDSVGGEASASGQNRGTDDQFEFRLQREKIVNAITSMNADIVGLMEIENNGFGESSAIQDLVDALNDELSDDEAYSLIKVADADLYKEKYFGSDAIMVGLLYRTAKVTPEGDALVIKTPEQHAPAGAATRGEGDDQESSPAYNKYQRHSLAQTFTIDGEKLTVVVNHFKSKGSECLEDWQGGFEDDDPTDLQGHCNSFRVSAADAIGAALTKVDGDVLILGDLNAYGKEDPLQVLTDYHPSTHGKVIKTAAYTSIGGEEFDAKQRVITESYGYVNLNTKLHGADTYSYSYSGELGNLDHALASADLAEKVVAIEDWHINGVESNMFEYGSKYTGDLVKSGNAFSSSDHDPVIIAIDLPDPVTPTPEPEEPKKKDSGSLGFLGLALLSLFGIRRRR